MFATIADIRFFVVCPFSCPQFWPCILLLQLNKGLQTIFTWGAFFVLSMALCQACFVCLSCLCLNYNNYSHKESRCSLFTQKYLGILSSRHLWKLVQISLLAEVNETFFGSFFVCLFVVCNAFSNFGWLKWKECLFATEYIWFFFNVNPRTKSWNVQLNSKIGICEIPDVSCELSTVSQSRF